MILVALYFDFLISEPKQRKKIDGITDRTERMESEDDDISLMYTAQDGLPRLI